MKRNRNTLRRFACLLLSTVMVLGLLPIPAAATAADDLEYELLGELSSRYEGGNAGAIVNNAGDIGGKSYGAYQFASASGVPMTFARWCMASDNEYYRYIGETLDAAYHKGGAGYGANFDAAWKALAEENYDGFFACQRYYVNDHYYHGVVDAVTEDVPGFDIHNYSIALRNVFLSRAVQHGIGGAYNVITRAFTALGGFANQPETDLIDAIYAESSKTRPAEDGESPMTGVSAQKYGVEGQVMSYYAGSSSDIQLGVFLRLRINEPAQAQNMLVTYGYIDAILDEGIYRFSPADNPDLAMGVKEAGTWLNTVDDSEGQQFRLTFYASGYYTVESVSTGLRLTARGDGSVTLAEPTANNDQLWKPENVNSGFSLCNRETGLYLAAGAAGSAVATGETAVQWQLTKSGADWSLDGANYPTYANILLEGKSNFPLRGMLRCTFPIQTVKVSVLKADGTNAFTPASASNINETTYSLSNLDSKTAFSKLKAGSYKLIIEATADGTDSKFYLESNFFVSDGTHILTFDPGEGTVSETSRNLAAGQKYGTLPVPVREGYIFIGWFTDPEGGEQVTPDTVAGAENKTVYARYEKAFTYTFVNYDGTQISTGTLLPGSVIPAPEKEPTRPSEEKFFYTFTGWEGYTEGMTISADVTFTAQYEQHELTAPPEITADGYTIRDGYLRTVALNTTLENLQQKLQPAEYITIGKGSATAEGVAATGMTVTYAVGGETVQTLTVVVTGDVNGDGQCTIADLVLINMHLLGRSSLKDAAASAADVNADGSVSIADLVLINMQLLGRSNLTPN